MNTMNTKNTSVKLETAVFGGGCFWCTEAIFQQLTGVESVVSGYAGGGSEKPTYAQVSTGDTGHAEVIRIEFDPVQISYDTLLTVFFGTHDPTTPDRQGNDVGTQYRSIILVSNDEQRDIATRYIKDLNKELGGAVVTAVEPLTHFYAAEGYHQDYYLNNSDDPYCKAIIDPKLIKLRKRFAHILSGTRKDV